MALIAFCSFLLSFLDPDRDIRHQQRQIYTELLTGPVVSNQARFCLDSCTFTALGVQNLQILLYFQWNILSEVVFSRVLVRYLFNFRFIVAHLLSLKVLSVLWGAQSKVLTPISLKNWVIDFALWHGALTCWKIKFTPMKLSQDGKA